MIFPDSTFKEGYFENNIYLGPTQASLEAARNRSNSPVSLIKPQGLQPPQ